MMAQMTRDEMIAFSNFHAMRFAALRAVLIVCDLLFVCAFVCGKWHGLAHDEDNDVDDTDADAF